MSRSIAPGRSRAVRVAARFRASPAEVFDAWLDPAIAGRWLFATAWRRMARVEIEPRVGGAFRFRDRGDVGPEHAGSYLEIAPPTRLAFTLILDPGGVATRVTVVIAALRSGCRLTLTQENLPPDRAGYAKTRWTGMLYGLGLTLDARLARRGGPAAPRRTIGCDGGRTVMVAAGATSDPSASPSHVDTGPVSRHYPGETPCNTC